MLQSAQVEEQVEYARTSWFLASTLVEYAGGEQHVLGQMGRWWTPFLVELEET